MNNSAPNHEVTITHPVEGGSIGRSFSVSGNCTETADHVGEVTVEITVSYRFQGAACPVERRVLPRQSVSANFVAPWQSKAFSLPNESGISDIVISAVLLNATCTLLAGPHIVSPGNPSLKAGT